MQLEILLQLEGDGQCGDMAGNTDYSVYGGAQVISCIVMAVKWFTAGTQLLDSTTSPPGEQHSEDGDPALQGQPEGPAAAEDPAQPANVFAFTHAQATPSLSRAGSAEAALRTEGQAGRGQHAPRSAQPGPSSEPARISNMRSRLRVALSAHSGPLEPGLVRSYLALRERLSTFESRHSLVPVAGSGDGPARTAAAGQNGARVPGHERQVQTQVETQAVSAERFAHEAGPVGEAHTPGMEGQGDAPHDDNQALDALLASAAQRQAQRMHEPAVPHQPATHRQHLVGQCSPHQQLADAHHEDLSAPCSRTSSIGGAGPSLQQQQQHAERQHSRPIRRLARQSSAAHQQHAHSGASVSVGAGLAAATMSSGHVAAWLGSMHSQDAAFGILGREDDALVDDANSRP